MIYCGLLKWPHPVQPVMKVSENDDISIPVNDEVKGHRG